MKGTGASLLRALPQLGNRLLVAGAEVRVAPSAPLSGALRALALPRDKFVLQLCTLSAALGCVPVVPGLSY